jgi:hypothetical protein
MKAILEFDLNDNEDQVAHMRAIKALDMALTLWDIDQYLRGQIKHGLIDDSAHKALSTTRDTLYSLMNNRNVDLDELLK